MTSAARSLFDSLSGARDMCNRRTGLILLLSLWLVAPQLGMALEAHDSIVVEWSGTTMGDIAYQIKVVAPSNQSVDEAERHVTAVLQRLNAAMSTYIPDSEVSRFNDSPTTEWFPVSSETAIVVAKSLEVSRHSDGAFDISVKPLVELWNFGAGRKDFLIPKDVDVERGRARIGYEKLFAQLEPPMIRKSQADLQIDLSAIAKGFIVDAVSRKLTELGFVNHFVEIGGEVMAHGIKPQGQPWRVGIERPHEVKREIQKIVGLLDQGMATSGDYRNFAIVDGTRYSHTIDPKTGRPVTHDLASATIVADDCMTADAIATAVLVLGQERGLELCKKLNVQLFGLVRKGDSFVEFATPGFQTLEPNSPANVAANPIWPVFVGSLVFFLLAVGGLLIGVLFSNKPIRGSCGGIGAVTGESSECNLCGNGPEQCVDKNTQANSS